jgi:CheY-like chemotaxis protein
MTVSQGSLLVVDDDAMNRDMLSRRLARHAYIASIVSCHARNTHINQKLGVQAMRLLFLLHKPDADILLTMQQEHRARKNKGSHAAQAAATCEQ